MASIDKVRRDLRARNNSLDGITDDLVNDLEKYQSEYEKLLLKENFDLDDGNLKRTSKNFERATSINPMKELGYEDISKDWVGKYPEVAKGQIAFNKGIGVESDLKFKDFTLVKVYQGVDLGAMLAEGRSIDALIKRELVNAIALEDNYKTTVDNISLAYLGQGEKLGQAANWADSVMRTSVFGLTRSIDKQIYEDIGEDKFIYVGALDKRTRDFCRARVGQEFTNEQIEEFGALNGSGLPGFFSPGGYRCRHSMIGASTID